MFGVYQPDLSADHNHDDGDRFRIHSFVATWRQDSCAKFDAQKQSRRGAHDSQLQLQLQLVLARSRALLWTGLQSDL